MLITNMKPKKPKLISLDKFEKELRKNPEYRKNEKEMKHELRKPKKPIIKVWTDKANPIFGSIIITNLFVDKKKALEYYDEVIPLYTSFTKPELYETH